VEQLAAEFPVVRQLEIIVVLVPVVVLVVRDLFYRVDLVLDQTSFQVQLCITEWVELVHRTIALELFSAQHPTPLQPLQPVAWVPMKPVPVVRTALRQAVVQAPISVVKVEVA
jgi:Ni,Fe-hydrogenase I cytochrome b subunit